MREKSKKLSQLTKKVITFVEQIDGLSIIPTITERMINPDRDTQSAKWKTRRSRDFNSPGNWDESLTSLDYQTYKPQNVIRFFEIVSGFEADLYKKVKLQIKAHHSDHKKKMSNLGVLATFDLSFDRNKNQDRAGIVVWTTMFMRLSPMRLIFACVQKIKRL